MSTSFERLKSERKRIGCKQKEVAEKLGCVSSTLLQYEKGTRQPNMEVLSSLANLGFDIQYIITGMRSDSAPLSPEERELLELYRNANSTLKLAAKTTLASGTKAGHVVTVNGSKNTVSVN